MPIGLPRRVVKRMGDVGRECRMEIYVPTLKEFAVMLEPQELSGVPSDVDMVRGRGRPAATPVHDALSMGVPVVQPMTHDLAGDDLPLRAFLAGDGSGWSFHLVSLSCTFSPRGREIFRWARVTVRLTAHGVQGELPPIAWSLTPLSASRPVEQTGTVTLGATLGFVGVSADLGTARRHKETFVTAYGLQQPVCSWEFTRTSTDELLGCQALRLVVRSPRGLRTRGDVQLEAVLARRSIGALGYRAAAPSAGEPLAFALDSA
jgi:hypothetical protein